MKRPFPHSALVWLTVLTVSVRLLAGPEIRPSAAPGEAHWVGAWMSAQQLCEEKNLPPAPGLAGATLRQIVRVSLGGPRLRIQFSNAFGAAPLTIASAQVAISLGDGAIRPESGRAILFQGQPSVAIPPGALIVSDPVELAVAPLSDLAVTIHLRSTPAALTAHPGSRTTSYLQAGAAVSAPSLAGATRIDHWYFLSGVEVEAPAAGVVVALGDSITDGRGSTTNQSARWPDVLARRLQADPAMSGVGVLNAGIGGNRILGDGIGPGALARFERDVLAQTGVRWLLVLEGVNDLGSRGVGSNVGAADLIAAYEQMICRARAHGIRVYGATIPPFGGSFYDRPENEADRQAVNRWIRESGAFDAVVDFDAAVRDSQHPERLANEADSGDHLHPNDEGYRRMGEAVDLRLFCGD